LQPQLLPPPQLQQQLQQQQQLSLGTDVALGSAVAAVDMAHTGLAGTSPLGHVELTIRVPMELSLPRDACLQDIRQAVADKLREVELEPTRDVAEMQLAVHGQCVSSEEARPLEPLQHGSVVSLVEDAAQVAELQAMQNCGLDPVQLQMMQMMQSRAQMGGPAWRGSGMVTRPRPDAAMREKYYKTQLCVNFTQGQCTYGARCTFAHGELELRQRASAPASSVPPGKGRWVSDTWWGEQWKDGPQWSKDAWGQSGGGGDGTWVPQ